MRFHKRGSNTDGQLLRKEFCFVQPEYCLLMGEELLFVLYQTKNENWMRTKLLLPRQFYGATLSGFDLYSLDKACISKIYAGYSLVQT